MSSSKPSSSSSSKPTLLKPGEPLPAIKPELLASKVDIIKTKKAAERGVGGLPTVTTWPKPSFGPATALIAEEDQTGWIVPAGSMFPLGCAIPNKTVLEYGAYFPPGTMFPDGVLVPIHARLVSVQAIKTLPKAKESPQPACIIM